ncbi:MAG TPA: fasciclin domain-containing protein [Pyrinomonadaceae bacterium]|nr:fasciclin domain-containing protein [Pyrinomonadaceae bacterium]
MQKERKENGVGFMDLVSKEPRFSKFNEAIATAGLTERFSGNFTVFAPTDEAFNKLPEDKVTGLLKPENRDYLKKLILLHVVPGTFSVDDLKKRDALKTEAGRDIKVDVSQDSKQITIANAKVTEPRKEAENWCLYAVDALLQPAASAARA